MFTKGNDYGCTKANGVSDMSNADVLIDKLKNAGIEYQRTELSFGTLTAEPVHLVHYVSPKSGCNMTVLVVPDAGADCWVEGYYHFPCMTKEDASKLKWIDVYEHVRQVAWETIKSKIPIAEKCPNCGKLDGVDGGGWYDDIRGRKRCKFCHNLKGN